MFFNLQTFDKRILGLFFVRNFCSKNLVHSLKVSNFASAFPRKVCNRNVAQLVAHYVRDVGVGRSSRLIPTSFQEHPFSVGAPLLSF